jgi:hypothetical protein
VAGRTRLSGYFFGLGSGFGDTSTGLPTGRITARGGFGGSGLIEWLSTQTMPIVNVSDNMRITSLLADVSAVSCDTDNLCYFAVAIWYGIHSQ